MLQADRAAYAKVETQKRLVWLPDGAYTEVVCARPCTVGARGAVGGEEGDNQRSSENRQDSE